MLQSLLPQILTRPRVRGQENRRGRRFMVAYGMPCLHELVQSAISRQGAIAGGKVPSIMSNVFNIKPIQTMQLSSSTCTDMLDRERKM